MTTKFSLRTYQMMSRAMAAMAWLAFVILPAVAHAQEFRNYYVTDVVGSPVVSTDIYSNTNWVEDYTPYGERIVETSYRIPAGDNERWFAGAPQSDVTGLVYLGDRYYDPVVGRFISVDPVGPLPDNGQNFNRYFYANNNPYKFIDSDGRLAWFIPIIWGIVALAAADAANAPGHGDVPIPQGDAARSALTQLAPIPGSGMLRQAAPKVIAPEVTKEVVKPLALPAPRQIAAAWGANTYRHGGLMTTIEHIWYRHGPKSGFAGVSRFAEGTRMGDISRYVDSALRYGKVTKTGQAAYTIEYNLGKNIGTDIAGNAASNIRVHVRDGIIQTAFPF